MKTSLIIQARMESTRLYGKILLPVRVQDRSMPILQAMIQRFKQSKLIDYIVVAAPMSPPNESIEFAITNADYFYFGSMDAVLERTLNAALTTNTDLIIDISSDCPLADPLHAEKLIDQFMTSDIDYISNASVRSWPDGCDIQVYPTRVLEEVNKLVTNKQHRTHSGWNITNFPEKFKQRNILAPKKYQLPDLGLTLDTKEDYLLLSKIYWIFSERYGEDPTKVKIERIIDLVMSRPELQNINKDIKRKIPGEEL